MTKSARTRFSLSGSWRASIASSFSGVICGRDSTRSRWTAARAETVRTLHRQLKEEGATLQGLKDEVRRTRAVELLHRTQRPIKQVAEAAGFENEKSFIRAFRGWTGQSPAEFRRKSGNGKAEERTTKHT